MSAVGNIFPFEKLSEMKEFLISGLNQIIGLENFEILKHNVKPILFGATSIFGIYYIIYEKRKNKNDEKLPGPKEWPIIGSIFTDNHLPLHQRFDKWAKIYGTEKGIYKVKLLSYEFIVVSSLEGLQECLLEKSLEFSGRSQSFRFQIGNRVPDDIIFTSYSPEWHARKKLAMKSMKMHGDGLENLEKITSEILDDFFDYLDVKQNSLWAVNDDLVYCFVNIIFGLAFGKRFAWDDPNIKMIKYSFDEAQVAQVNPSGVIMDQFPILWKLGLPKHVAKGLQKGLNIIAWFEKEIESVLETYTPNKPRGYLDIFYQEYLKEKELENNKISFSQLIMMTIQTLLAGYATTATAVTCLLQYLVKSPDIQEKMYEEIVRNVGKEKRPGLEDKTNHPYTQASIYELLRLISHVPFSIHCPIKDSSLCGYRIPKNSRVITHFWTLHHDEKIFPEPYSFKPERFLDSEGKLVPPGHPRRKALFPFGAGRRVCLGETLAKNRLFLVISAMVQRYKFSPKDYESSQKADPRNYDFGIVLNPGDVTVKIEKRV